MPTYINRKVTRRYSAAGAIDINATSVVLNSSGGAAMTLPDPPASPHWNGHQMTIQCLTAQTHTVTNTTGFNGAGSTSDVITLDAVNESAVIEAYDGKWWIVNLQGAGVG